MTSILTAEVKSMIMSSEFGEITANCYVRRPVQSCVVSYTQQVVKTCQKGFLLNNKR
jgi:hypothetical protein